MEHKKDLIDILISEWKDERPELDTSAMQIIGRILHLGKTLEKRASKTLEVYGIHYTDFDVLATIRRSGEPFELTPSRLMQSVLITSGAMTALLNRLQKLELIYRAPDLKDGRIKLVGLTPKGVNLIDKALDTRFNEACTAISCFNETEKKELEKHLKKFIFSLKPVE